MIRILTTFLLVNLLIQSCDSQYQYLGRFPPTLKGKEEWKSVVVIEYDLHHVCSGSVIGKNMVLTAAHCVDPKFSNNQGFQRSSLTCRVGGFIHELEDTVIPVDSIKFHPKYNLTTGAADLAMLQLKHPIRADINPMKLPSNQLMYGSRCHMVGWKDLSFDPNVSQMIPHFVPIPKRAVYDSEQFLMDLASCEDVLRKITLNVYNEIMPSSESIICPNSICSKTNSNASFSDSGSPLLCEDELHGIQSYMLDVDGTNIEAFFVSTRVDKYMNWITNNLKPVKSPVVPKILTEEDVKDNEEEELEVRDKEEGVWMVPDESRGTTITLLNVFFLIWGNIVYSLLFL